MSRQCKNDVIWKTKFGQLLKHAFITLELDYTDFCHKYNWSTSTFRYWTYGRNLPQRKALFDIKEYLIKEVGINCIIKSRFLKIYMLFLKKWTRIIHIIV